MTQKRVYHITVERYQLFYSLSIRIRGTNSVSKIKSFPCVNDWNICHDLRMK